MGGDFLAKFTGFVEQDLKIGGSAPKFGRGGGANFSIGHRSTPSGSETVQCRPARFYSVTRQQAPLQHIPALAKIPETFSPRAGQTRLNFRKFRFFPDF